MKNKVKRKRKKETSAFNSILFRSISESLEKTMVFLIMFYVLLLLACDERFVLQDSTLYSFKKEKVGMRKATMILDRSFTGL